MPWSDFVVLIDDFPPLTAYRKFITNTDAGCADGPNLK